MNIIQINMMREPDTYSDLVNVAVLVQGAVNDVAAYYGLIDGFDYLNDSAINRIAHTGVKLFENEARERFVIPEGLEYRR